jgi:hypothetical protein
VGSRIEFRPVDREHASAARAAHHERVSSNRRPIPAGRTGEVTIPPRGWQFHDIARARDHGPTAWRAGDGFQPGVRDGERRAIHVEDDAVVRGPDDAIPCAPAEATIHIEL